VGYQDNAYIQDYPCTYEINTEHPIPVNAVAGTATLTYTHETNPTAGKLVTVNGKAYKFTATAVAAEGDILIGADENATMTNLQDAIKTGGVTAGHKVAVAHPTVTAEIAAGSHLVTLTARTKGTIGDAYTVTTDEASITASDFVDESTGVDGTLGVKYEVRFDDDNIYLCSAGNKISDANWVTGAI
jgi:hypothetical protein